MTTRRKGHKVLVGGLVKFLPAVDYQSCLNLPTSFSYLLTKTLANVLYIVNFVAPALDEAFFLPPFSYAHRSFGTNLSYHTKGKSAGAVWSVGQNTYLKIRKQRLGTSMIMI